MKQQALDDLREWLIKYTGCDVQQGWPCGTCAIKFLRDIGLTEDTGGYDEHNDPLDRMNEVWRAILQLREGSDRYKEQELKEAYL